MVYTATYRVCNNCDRNKLEEDFYKTIKDVCKTCRDEYTREIRQQSKEERNIIDMRRDKDIKKLKKITDTHDETIDDVKSKVKSIEKKLDTMMTKLEDLSLLEARLKGASMRKIRR